MKKSDLIKKLSKEFSIPQEAAKSFVDSFFEEITNITLERGRLELRGFGVFKVRRMCGRFIRNPKTDVEMYIDERYTLNFKPSKTIR
ncbi:MAG: integration host factor subunit beta [Acidobacteria bacterium]|jgi:nucleoid DNA-binding protein|nr:MAG: integration host factor subunit beta [Acidobacteriota bacterium]